MRRMTYQLLDILFVLGLLFKIAVCDPCTAGATIGSNSLQDNNDGPSVGYVTFMVEPMASSQYTIACCGIANVVNFKTSGAGNVTFQIWRPDSGSVFTLIDQETKVVGASGTHNLSIALSLKPGDRYGWYSSSDIIMYKQTGLGSLIERVDRFVSTFTTTVGQTLDFSTTGEASFEDNVQISPALRFYLDPGNVPTLTSSAGLTVNLNTADPIGTYITTLTAADNDIGDALNITMTTVTSNYTLNVYAPRLANITTAASLAGITRTETLVFLVTDPCGSNNTLTLTLNITNDPPVIHNLPASDMLHEDVTTLTYLRTINATDSVDSVTCSMVTTDPFQVTLVTLTTDEYAVYSLANPGFSYMTKNFYKMTIQCTDGDPSNTVSALYYVFLLNNHTPNITNLQDSVTISTSHSTSTPVYTVTAVDDEGDDMNFTLSCDPITPCPFQILKTGVVLLTTSISTTTITGYDLRIVVNDARSTANSKTLTVIITDINDPVAITNLPLTASMPVRENTAILTSIFNVTSADQDASQTLTYSMTSSGTGLTYFTIDPSTGEIKTGLTVMNYETLLAASETSFTLNISVTDGIATDWETLDIDVIDINETPTFSQTSYSLTSSLSSAGTVIGLPTYAVVDPDTGDSKTYDMVCGNGYFYMDSSNGQVEIQADYDLDSGLSQSVTCSVAVYDSQGLNDTALLHIYLDNQNDHVPEFNPMQYSFPVSYYAAVGTSVGQVTAYDDDLGVYGTKYFALNQTHLGNEYFRISNTGLITVAASLAPLGPDVAVNITGVVYDGGSLSDTAPIIIFVSELVLATTTPEGPRYRTFSEDSRNMPWLVGSLIVLVTIMGLGAWTGYTCRGENGIATTLRTCRRRHLRPQLWRKLPGIKSEPSTGKFPPPVETSLPPSLLMDLTVRNPPPPKRLQQWRSGDEGAPAGTHVVTRDVTYHDTQNVAHNDSGNDSPNDLRSVSRDDPRNDTPLTAMQELDTHEGELSESPVQTTTL